MLRTLRIMLAFLGFAGIGSAALAAEAKPNAPQYDLHVTLDNAKHTADIKQIITWTNRSDKPARELILNFYPVYKIPRSEYLLLAKTLELLRLNPAYGIDPEGENGKINDIRWRDPHNVGTTKRPKYSFRDDNMCAMVVELPEPVEPGGKVVLEVDAVIHLPNKQGRWGHWEGVTYLTHSLPTVAYHDNAGWHAMPFVPWHQPFWNDAGIYHAKITVAEDEKIACSAVAKEVIAGKGTKTVVYEPFTGRDFAIIASAKFNEYTKAIKLHNGKNVTLRCLAFPQHEWFANEMLQIAEEAILTYSKWFAPYPYSQFTIAESYFGWNGNECAGLVMIDERVFDMPKAGRGYVEYLLSHETCHQWWYNLVGTNGYSETFMDEGPATYFTHRYLDRKRGPKNAIVEWSDIKAAPFIRRDVYRFASMYNAIRKDEMPAAIGPLPEFGNLFNLFTGAYDRGSKVFGLIEERMGETAFMDFVQELQAKYSFGMLSAAGLQKELETYTGKNWNELFDRWVYSNGLTDWAVEDVRIERRRLPRLGPLQKTVRNESAYHVSVLVKQKGQYDEPTVIGFQFEGQKGFPVRVPIGPTTATRSMPEYEATVEPAGKNLLRVTLVLPEKPTNVEIDPDRVLLDADPNNNAWERPSKFQFVPLYSMLTDNDLTNDYDRWNLKAGPWVCGASYQDPWYTRSTMVGVRAGAMRTQEFTGGVYVAARSDYRDIVAGVDGLFDHWPHPKMQVGFNYEARLAGPFFGTEGQDGVHRANLFARYVFQYGSSLYLPPIHYVEAYSTYQDNFLPYANNTGPGGVRPTSSWINGAHYRLNLYTPYWDAERGIWVDAILGGGTANLNQQQSAAYQTRVEIATAQKLPDGYGWFSDIRVAARGVVAASWPDQGEFFALGGSTLFRGFDLAERQGSAYWVGNFEARLPVAKDLHWNFADNAMGVRNLWLATFYDVGAIYTERRLVNNVAHAVGLGVRVDTAVFSFIERATLRVDVAKTLNAGTPVQVWFGLQHPF